MFFIVLDLLLNGKVELNLHIDFAFSRMKIIQKDLNYASVLSPYRSNSNSLGRPLLEPKVVNFLF